VYGGTSMVNMFFLADCTVDADILSVVSIIVKIIKIVLIFVPIAIIIVSALGFIRIVTAGNPDVTKDNIKKLGIRLLAAVLTFLAPSIIMGLFKAMDVVNIEFASYVTCANDDGIVEAATYETNEIISEVEEEIAKGTSANLPRIKPRLARARNLIDKYLSSSKTGNPTYASEKISAIENLKDQIAAIENQIDEADRQSRIAEIEKKQTDSADIGGPLQVSQSDALVENIAVMIANEVGCFEGGTAAQLIAGAIFVNNVNLGYFVSKNSEWPCDSGNFEECSKVPINEETVYNILTLGEAYYDGINGIYPYVNATFDSVEALYPERGHSSEEQRNRCITATKIVLAKKFVLPYNMTYAASTEIILSDNPTGEIWEVPTGISGINATFGYSSLRAPISTKSIYGTDVSNDLNYYLDLANELDKAYFK